MLFNLCYQINFPFSIAWRFKTLLSRQKLQSLDFQCPVSSKSTFQSACRSLCLYICHSLCLFARLSINVHVCLSLFNIVFSSDCAFLSPSQSIHACLVCMHFPCYVCLSFTVWVCLLHKSCLSISVHVCLSLTVIVCRLSLLYYACWSVCSYAILSLYVIWPISVNPSTQLVCLQSYLSAFPLSERYIPRLYLA